MNDQVFQQIFEVHVQRQRSIFAEIEQLLEEAKSITAELVRLHEERKAKQKETVRHGQSL